MGFLYFILSYLLGIWPFKFRKQAVRRSGRPRRFDSQAVEYALWFPFLGWGSVWAVYLGPTQIPNWHLVSVCFDRSDHLDFRRNCDNQSDEQIPPDGKSLH